MTYLERFEVVSKSKKNVFSKNTFPWPILVIFMFFERTEAKFSFFENIISKHQFLPKLWPFE